MRLHKKMACVVMPWISAMAAYTWPSHPFRLPNRVLNIQWLHPVFTKGKVIPGYTFFLN